MRLAAVLEMRRHDPEGKEHGPEAYVFGNEVGERIGSITKAWMTVVLRAHGHRPKWVKGKKNQLASESLAAYHAINLEPSCGNSPPPDSDTSESTEVVKH
jgi:hypothetical protein